MHKLKRIFYKTFCSGKKHVKTGGCASVSNMFKVKLAMEAKILLYQGIDDSLMPIAFEMVLLVQ